MLTSLVILRLLLASIFVLSASDKFVDRRRFTRVVRSYSLLPARAAPLAAVMLTAFEATVAAALVEGGRTQVVAGATAALVAGFAAAVTVNIRRGNLIDCGCGGWSRSSQIGWSLVVRNAVIAGAACALAIWPPASLPALVAQGRIRPFEIVALATVAVIVPTTAAVARYAVDTAKKSHAVGQKLGAAR